MRTFVLIQLITIPLLLASGCDASSESAADEHSEHAAEGYEPGSHEDWCGEHQVPESMCTRCNPSLAAAFQATGDWCEEHELPESQCRQCNPDLEITRPPAGQ